MLFILSALCYLLPFYLPFFWPLEWLFPPFLYMALTQKTVRLQHCALWSIGTTFFHIMPLCAALLAMTSRQFYYACIAPGILLGYISLYTLSWLCITLFVLRKIESLITSLTFWTLSLWIYLLSLEHVLLWPFGRCEGTLFMNPLLPMAYAPHILAPLSYLPFSAVVLWFCIITSSSTALYFSDSRTYAWSTMTLILPWCLMTWHVQSPSTPSWIATVGHLPISLPQSISLQGAQCVIRYELNRITHTHPQIRLIILPESSWNNALLSSAHELTWIKNHTISDLLIGSFYDNGSIQRNSLYWYQNGTRMQRCDKRHAVPLVERATLNMPQFCSQLYFQNSLPITPSEKPRSTLKIPTIPPLSPYICSDLYCNTYSDDETNNTLLATSNDAWFMPHFTILMALAVRFKAIQWHRPILYISYHHAYYCDPFGKITTLSTAAPSRMIQ